MTVTIISQKQIIDIVNNLSNGGMRNFKTYEDNKIILAVDTYVPNAFIDIKLGEDDQITVFQCNQEGLITEYKEGKWEGYVLNLHKKAKAVIAEKEEIVTRKKAIEWKIAKDRMARADAVFA